MTTSGTKTRALCVATRCTTVDQFVATFHRFCGDDQTFFVATLTSRPIGLETPFSIQLADKQPVLRGLCIVLDAWATPENRYKRPGIRLGIKRLTADSQLVFDRLRAASKSLGVAEATPPPGPPPESPIAARGSPQSPIAARGSPPESPIAVRGSPPESPIAVRGSPPPQPLPAMAHPPPSAARGSPPPAPQPPVTLRGAAQSSPVHSPPVQSPPVQSPPVQSPPLQSPPVQARTTAMPPPLPRVITARREPLLDTAPPLPPVPSVQANRPVLDL